MLEIGPGTSYYTLPVAARLQPEGKLQIVDVQQRYLDHTVERARRAGLANVVPALAGGGCLPFADRTFDAAYLVSTLGEIPDPAAALRELRRVLKPAAPLVVGEILIDPDFPRLKWLAKHADASGLVLEEHLGTPLGYFARFRPADK